MMSTILFLSFFFAKENETCMPERMKQRLTRVLDYLLPRCCLQCNTSGAYLCTPCKKQLKAHPELCPFCHRVRPFSAVCVDCKTHQKALEGVMVAFQYTDLVKKLILHLKFYHKYDVAQFLAKRLVFLLRTNPALMCALHEQKLFISYVPSHRIRYWWIKGYNQSRLLAQHVSQELEAPCLSLRKKTKWTRSQTKLNRAQRLKSLRNAFTTEETIIPDQATILIIDDITTTGATLHELAVTLKKHRPDLHIRGAVIGRHGK